MPKGNTCYYCDKPIYGSSAKLLNGELAHKACGNKYIDTAGLRITVVKKIPQAPSGGVAGFDRRKRAIYILPNADAIDVNHEVGHYVLGHSTDFLPKRAKVYVDHEIDADAYAQRKVHRQFNNVGMLKGMVEQLTSKSKQKYDRGYGLNKEKAVNMISNSLARSGIPNHWRKAWERSKHRI